jgi:hypothetical protein
MAFPDTLLGAASTWFSNVMVTAAHIQANVTDALNALATRVTSIGQGFIDGDDGAVTGGTTLPNTTDYVPADGISVTFTLTAQRRVRICGSATINPASATLGQYYTRPCYNAGATIGTPILASPAVATVNDQSTYTFSTRSDGTALLAAGTYTAYMAVKRNAGGSASDAISSSHVDVYDVGSI